MSTAGIEDECRGLLERLRSCRRLLRASPSPVRIRVGTSNTLLREACTAFAIDNVELRSAELTQPTALEQVVERRLALERLSDVGTAALAGLIAEVAASDPRSELKCHRVAGRHGLTTHVWELGDPRAVPFVALLPYGVPVELSLGMAQLARQHFRCLVVEGPELTADAAAFERVQFERHESATDLLAVLDALELERVHLLGMCASALPSLRFAATHPQRVLSILLGNGSFMVEGLPWNRYQREFFRLVSQVQGRRDRARAVHRFLSCQPPKQADPEWAHVTLLPYANESLFYMYMNCCHRLHGEPSDATELMSWLGGIRCDAFVLSSKHDEVTHPEAGAWIASQLPGCQLVTDEGTHLSPLSSPLPSSWQAMLAFCRRAEGAFNVD